MLMCLSVRMPVYVVPSEASMSPPIPPGGGGGVAEGYKLPDVSAGISARLHCCAASA